MITWLKRLLSIDCKNNRNNFTLKFVLGDKVWYKKPYSVHPATVIGIDLVNRKYVIRYFCGFELVKEDEIFFRFELSESGKWE